MRRGRGARRSLPATLPAGASPRQQGWPHSWRWVYYSLHAEAVGDTTAPLLEVVGTWRARL